MTKPGSMKSNECIKFVATGDIMLGDHPVVIGHGVRSVLKKRGSDFAFKHVAKILQKADISFGNLESILSDIGLNKSSLSSIELRGAPDFAESLKRAGFDILAAANNHILQHGPTPYYETLDLLSIEQIQIAGRKIAGSPFHSEPVWFNIRGVIVVIFGYSMRPEKYYPSRPVYSIGSISKVIEDISRVKHKAHNVIISLHWGDEFINWPSLDRIREGRMLIDAGADVVVGHHPHVLQGIEQYKHGVIAYSLGNFVLDMWQEAMRESMILTCELTTEGLKSYNYIPCFINSTYQPVPLIGREEERLKAKIEKWSQHLNNEEFSNESLKNQFYLKEMRVNLYKYRIECYLYFLTHFWKYKPSLYVQSLKRAFLRRFSSEGEGILY